MFAFAILLSQFLNTPLVVRVTFCVCHDERRRALTVDFYARKQLLLSARLSHRNSVCLSVRLSHARITKSSPSGAWKTL